MIVQVYQGGTPQVIKEIFTQKLTGKTIPLSKSVKNNRLFFSAKIFTNTAGTEYNEGIWSFGRKSAGYPFALTLDFIDENVDTDGIQAFGSAANFFFITHSNDGSIDKLNDAASYTFTSIYESQIYNFGFPYSDKRPQKFSLSTAPLTSGQSATIKYKIDGDTSWTTVGTINTVGQVSRDFFNHESDSTDFKGGREVKVRIESAGGAEITGFSVQAEVLIGSVSLNS